MHLVKPLFDQLYSFLVIRRKEVPVSYDPQKTASNLAIESRRKAIKRLSINVMTEKIVFATALISKPIKNVTMAKQRGIFKAEGTIDDITFYKSKDGFLMRQKGGVSAERIASDPAFARTRENQQEFSRAGKAGKVLRAALRSLLMNAADRLMVSRLFTEMMKVVKADLTSDRGQRNVLDGELELLEGFEFNENGKLGQTLFAPFQALIDRVNSSITLSVPPFVPINSIAAPSEATHYQIASAGGFIDFETGTNNIVSKATDVLPIDSDPTVAVSHVLDGGADATRPMFIVVGISFYQEVNGKNYSLKNGTYNALAIVKVDGGV